MNWSFVGAILGILGAAAALFAILMILAKPAECAWCPTYKCFGPCPGDCVCMIPPGQVGGACVSYLNIQSLKSEGWKEIR